VKFWDQEGGSGSLISDVDIVVVVIPAAAAVTFFN
jgi:hypothetical protein